MIIALKKDIRKEEQDRLIAWLESYGVRTHISEGEYQTVVGLVGDTTQIDTDLISGLDIVQSVTRISEPFKKANWKFHPDDTVIRVTDQQSGKAARECCAAAHSNRERLPMIFRGCTEKESGSCWK